MKSKFTFLLWQCLARRAAFDHVSDGRAVVAVTCGVFAAPLVVDLEHGLAVSVSFKCWPGRCFTVVSIVSVGVVVPMDCFPGPMDCFPGPMDCFPGIVLRMPLFHRRLRLSRRHPLIRHRRSTGLLHSHDYYHLSLWFLYRRFGLVYLLKKMLLDFFKRGCIAIGCYNRCCYLS
jgi:hypothetical protein